MDIMFDSVPCHLDLLSGNILFNENENSVTFVDYEYCSYAYRGYDIANHFNEFAGFDCDFEKWYPKPKAQKTFLRSYFSEWKDLEINDNFLIHCIDIIDGFRALNHIYWGVWGIVQAK